MSSDTLSEAPHFSELEAAEILKQIFGLSGVLLALPSERDQNFHVKTPNRGQFVLKIANSQEQKEILEFQNEALEYLALQGIEGLPLVCESTDNQRIVTVVDSAARPFYARLLRYISAPLMGELAHRPLGLLESMGRYLGRLDRVLATFSHPAQSRRLKWDLGEAAWIRDSLPAIQDPFVREQAERIVFDFETFVLPSLAVLRRSVIHNDPNDHNLLVSHNDWRRLEVVGIIDFGDMLESCTVFDPAIGCCYGMLDQEEPLRAAQHVVAGYHDEYPLQDTELAILFDLIRMRVAVSAVNAALEREQNPGNQYLQISQKGIRKLLFQLEPIHRREALYCLRQACGLEPCPHQTHIVRRIREAAGEFGPVLGNGLQHGSRAVLDLSVRSEELNASQILNFRRLRDRIQEWMDQQGVDVALGRYGEARLIYRADTFIGGDGSWGRTIHLGVDLFAAGGTPVLAPLDGSVHSLADNSREMDYGPTLLLEHRLKEIRFFTLYGHLSRESLRSLQVGQRIARGDKIGQLGEPGENGGWAAHLHIQLICDLLDREGDFPGVAPAWAQQTWFSLCPDPNLILQLPELSLPAADWHTARILQSRQEHLGPSLSLSYQQPLHIVRGFGQYLYDQVGRRFLDGVNNVAHVGHCHPAVVAAEQRQTSVLNTNTRYLHENLARYSEELCRRLPDPLSVCFFVCSGSEANELALRLARCHTQNRGFLVIEGAYHGNTHTLVEISPYKFDGPGGRGAPAHVFKVPMPDGYRGPYKHTEPGIGARYAEQLENKLIEMKRSGMSPAAFIYEPILGCGGQIVLPEGYLQEAQQRVRAAGGVCIADEVQVGFGRVGSHFWGFQTQGVVPDIVTLGKPIGNGHPLAAVVTTPEIALSFANGMEYFNTFGGNPVSCAVGLAVLRVIDEEGLQRHAQAVGENLLDGLRELMERHSLIGEVRGLGLFVGLELVRDRQSLAPAAEEAAYIVERMKEKGILLSTDGPWHNVIKIKPPLPFDQENASQLVTALDRVLQEDMGCLFGG